MAASSCDVVVIGGGITGLSVAVHAARRGLSTTLIESHDLGGVSTQRSGALVRTHYEDAASAQLALRGLELFESFEERYGGPSGFLPTGFAYVPTVQERDSGAFAQRVAMLQSVGVETQVVDEAQLAAIDPSLSIADVGVAAFEPRSGFADPGTTCRTLARAAAEAGARLLSQTTVLRLLNGEGDEVAGVEFQSPGLDPEVLEAGHVVLCAGAWSTVLAQGAGVDLPIRPTAVKLAFAERRGPMHLTVIDAPGGIYLRPDPAGRTLVGRRTWTDEPLPSPDSALPSVDRDFIDDTVPRLANRLPATAGVRVVGTRAGMLDMTPDALPLVGPAQRPSGEPAPGLWLCCGWSGTGFKTGPSVGEALAEWIDTGACGLDVSSYDPARSFGPAAGSAAEPVRSPH